MRQTDLQILDSLISDDYKPHIEAALKRIRSVYVKSRTIVGENLPPPMTKRRCKSTPSTAAYARN